MRAGLLGVLTGVGLSFAATTGTSARTTPVAVTQTSANLSQALTPLPALRFTPGRPPPGVRVISIDDTRRFQTMQGFGAAMTDTSAWLIWDELTPGRRSQLMHELFAPGPSGIHISYVRVPIGATDFTRGSKPYSYDDLPPGQSDPALEHFSIAHDEAYILPALRAMRAINPSVITLASEWSPPTWMKRDGTWGNPGLSTGGLRPEDYSVLANYLVRFLRAYAAAGVPIQAITPQNEPVQASYYPGLELTESQEARFIAEDLVPALQAGGLDPKLLGYDFEWSCANNTTASPCDQRYPDELAADPQAGAALAGIAWHCYAGDVHRMTTFHVLRPQLDQVVSECASGLLTPGPPAQLEISAARNWASAVVLWNIALDSHGGPVQPPNFGCAGCIGLVTVGERTHGYRLTRDYYQLGQASRYVAQGAVRIASNTFVKDKYTDVNRLGGYTTPGLDDVAFLNPDGTRVLLTYNSSRLPIHFAVRWRGSYLTYTLAARAIATFRWSPRH